jgi:ABC-type bacteriocin/lantibiotic exporter with double-glycine peptidase domain
MVIIKNTLNFFLKILLIVGKNFRLKIFKILSFGFILSLMEFIGISLFVSFIILIFNNNEIKLFSLVDLNYFSKVQLIYFIFATYTLKLIISLYSQVKINNYLFDLHFDLSNKLLKYYLKKPYPFFVETNSSILTRNIYSEIGVFIYQIIISLSAIINDIILVLLLLILLLANDLINTAIVFSFFSFFYCLFYFISKPYIKKWGEILMTQKYLVHNDLKQTFNSIKEIKVFGSENFFLNKFSNNFYKYSSSSKNQNILSHLPKLFFEYLLILFFFLLILFLEMRNINSGNIFVSLVLFSTVSLRLLPSIIRILTQIQGIIFYKTSVDTLYKVVKDSESKKNKREIIEKNISEVNLKIKKTLDIKNLNFSYVIDKNNKIIFENINCKFYINNIIGIFGPSGEGKTTLVDIIAGLLEPTKGKILIDGVTNLNNKNIKSKWIEKVGYVTQNIYLLNDTIKKNILYDSKVFDNKRFSLAIRQSKFYEVIKNLPKKENTLISENAKNLSAGQIKRLALARALYRDPQLLIMDETTSSLDHENEDKILSNLNNLKKNKIIIIISHNRSISKFCDKTYILKDCKLNFQKPN